MATMTDPELTRIFDLLGHSHRRHVLRYLERESEVVSVETLATAVAESTCAPMYAGPRQTEEEEARIALHHVHLPKLAAGGLLTYHSGAGTVERAEGDRAGRLLDDVSAIADGVAPQCDD
ncbi:DUF7344 domain-containing protein [Haloarcula sediminis]|uniref:DUF7344 domain-containing protein n=1 Tax=Haloarcula sediminis TaxID=3111777 RepID=UPI002D774C37|nr:hypothetical protein [Haloarcula sp. CK38]